MTEVIDVGQLLARINWCGARAGIFLIASVLAICSIRSRSFGYLSPIGRLAVALGGLFCVACLYLCAISMVCDLSVIISLWWIGSEPIAIFNGLLVYAVGLSCGVIGIRRILCGEARTIPN